MILRRYSVNEDAKGPQGPKASPGVGPKSGNNSKPQRGPKGDPRGGAPGPHHIIDADAAILISNVLPTRPAGAKAAFDHAVESILRCINNCTTTEELSYYKKALKSVVSEITKRA